MVPNESASVPLPAHLARYVVAQDYLAYTPRDHAVWRHILGQLTTQLKDKAHPSYLAGLAAAGIGVERIPSLTEMNGNLARLGWSAVAVRGFIPPAVFTEMLPLLPSHYRPLIQALVQENNELLVRVQQRARQNQLLLSHAVELMQRFINAILPGASPATYDGAGRLPANSLMPNSLYEAVG